MKWTRSFVPTGLYLLGITSATVVGIAIAGQDQDEAKPAQPKSSAANTQNAADEAAPDRNQPATNRTNNNRADRTTAEGQRAAALGVQFDAKADQGLTAATVQPNGVLAQGGLRQNDRIISADGRAFNNPRQLEAYLWGQSGRSVPIIVDRGGQRFTIQANIPMHATTAGWLGVFLDEGENNIKGARVTQVYPSGPAARAGIHVGDIITQIDTKPVENSAEGVMLIRELQPKAEVVFTINRDNQEQKVPVTIGTRGNSNYQSFYAGAQQFQQQGQNGQQPNPNEQQHAAQDQFHGVPPHAMQLENDRRNAEQHERIENEIRLLRDEIQKLRELIEQNNKK
jgi:C-terminal processing protease CtpA/Prc